MPIKKFFYSHIFFSPSSYENFSFFSGYGFLRIRKGFGFILWRTFLPKRHSPWLPDHNPFLLAWRISYSSHIIPSAGSHKLAYEGTSKFTFLFSRPVYPELAALVGATVPDYRGYFLRGVGGNSASLGEKQGDAIKHPTTESVLHFWKSFENCWATGVFSIPNQSEYDVTIKKSNSSHSFPRKLRFDLANAWESGYTAVETRPVNRAVRYLIRARWLAKLSESPYLKTQEGRQVL